MFAIRPYFRFSDDDYRLLPLEELTTPAIDPRYLLLRNAALARESEVQNTDNEFCIRLDLKPFKPEEVNITSSRHRITVRAKHEEKKDKHGSVAREITRIYKLPEGVDHRSVTSSMNSQGILKIKATKDNSVPVHFRSEA